jgi:putative transposase
MSGDPVGAKVEFGEGDRSAGRCDGREGCAGASRSDNGPKFVAKGLRKWLAGTGARTAYIEPGSPWENGYCKSFNSKLRDESSTVKSFARWRRSGYWRMARPLQHHPAALIAGLPTTGTRGLGGKQLRAWRSGTATRFPLLHIPDCDEVSTKLAALH